MAEKRGPGRPPKHEDEPVTIPLDFETALRGLMATGEHSEEKIERAVARACEDDRESRE